MNEITISLEKEAASPLFMQLYEYIKMEITSGHYPKNEKLPSKRQLAASLQCSQNTVQAAYNQLAAEGFLIPRAKSGYYVAELDGIVQIGIDREVASGHTNKAMHFKYDFRIKGLISTASRFQHGEK